MLLSERPTLSPKTNERQRERVWLHRCKRVQTERMALLKLSFTRTVVFLIFLLVASIYRVIFETRLWQETTLTSSADGLDTYGKHFFLNHGHSDRSNATEQNNAKSQASMSVPKATNSSTSSRIQRHSVRNESHPLFIRRDDGDLLTFYTGINTSESTQPLSSILPSWNGWFVSRVVSHRPMNGVQPWFDPAMARA